MNNFLLVKIYINWLIVYVFIFRYLRFYFSNNLVFFLIILYVFGVVWFSEEFAGGIFFHSHLCSQMPVWWFPPPQIKHIFVGGHWWIVCFVQRHHLHLVLLMSQFIRPFRSSARYFGYFIIWCSSEPHTWHGYVDGQGGYCCRFVAYCCW